KTAIASSLFPSLPIALKLLHLSAQGKKEQMRIGKTSRDDVVFPFSPFSSTSTQAAPTSPLRARWRKKAESVGRSLFPPVKHAKRGSRSFKTHGNVVVEKGKRKKEKGEGHRVGCLFPA